MMFATTTTAAAVRTFSSSAPRARCVAVAAGSSTVVSSSSSTRNVNKITSTLLSSPGRLVLSRRRGLQQACKAGGDQAPGPLDGLVDSPLKAAMAAKAADGEDGLVDGDEDLLEVENVPPMQFLLSSTAFYVLMGVGSQVGLALPGVSEWFRLQLVCLTIRPTRVGTPRGCQSGYVDLTGCHQLNRVLTAK
jgi:hypothetical protein